MNPERQCPQCHQPLAADAPAGLCPQCLLAQALVAPPAGTSVRYFGDYELVKEIARGAMGVVYQARQVSLNRFVALKMILTGKLATPELIQRFRIEAEAAAHLDHPHIVPIYEVGEYDGIQYFSMRLLEGGSLVRLAAHRYLGDPRAAAGLLITLARAVHYAHQRGILHRDLKPANILLDAEGRVQVSDFGLAKLLENKADVTVSGAVMGTPAYMAPEQAAGDTHRLTTAVDIYGLGAILYHLLTGQPPFQEETPLATLKKVLEAEPARPRALNPKIDRDLETICLKCLQKEPDQRYESAEALARDLERWLAGEPIQARPVGILERLGKWMRRRKAVSALIVLALLAAAGFAAGLYWHNQRLQRERNHAEELLSRAQAEQGVQMLKSGNDTGLLPLLQAVRTAANNPQLQDMWSALWAGWHEPSRGRLLQMPGGKDPCRALALSPDGKILATATDQQVDFWNVDTGAPHGRPLAIARDLNMDQVLQKLYPGEGMKSLRDFMTKFGSGTEPVIQRMVWRPDGKLLIELKGEIRQVWDPEAAAPDGDVFCPDDCDPDGLVSLSRGFNCFRLKDARTREFLGPPTEQAPKDTRYMAISPGGKRLAIAQANIALWDMTTGHAVSMALEGSAEGRQLLFSRDGALLAALLKGGNIMVWDAATGKLRGGPLPRQEFRPASHNRWESGLAFSPDSRLLAFNALNGVHLYRTDSLEPVGSPIVNHGAILHATAFSPDGELLLTATADGQLQFWSTRDLQPVGRAFHHPGPILDARFAPDGQRLATLSLDGSVRIWAVPFPELPATQSRFAGPLRGITFSAAADCMAVQDRGQPLQFHSIATGKPLGRPLPLNPKEWVMAFSPDARVLATVEDHRLVRIRDRLTGQILGQLPEAAVTVNSANFSPDGQRLATLTLGGSQWNATIRIWDTDQLQPSGQPIPALLGMKVCFSSDGRLVLGYGANGWMAWDATTGAWRYGNPEDPEKIRYPALSGNKRYLAAIQPPDSDTVQVIDLETGAPRGRPLALKGVKAFAQIAISADGATAAIGSGDGTTLLWDVDTGRVKGQPLPVYGRMEFSPDGRYLVVGNNEASLWQVASQYPLPLPAITGWVGFSPDNAWLQYRPANQDMLWRLPKLPADFHDMALQTWVALGIRLGTNGIVEAISGPEWRRLRDRLPPEEPRTEPEWVFTPQNPADAKRIPAAEVSAPAEPPAKPFRQETIRDRVAQLAGYDPAVATTVVIHYNRPDRDYAGWQLRIWPGETPAQGRDLEFTGTDAFGPYAVIGCTDRVARAGFRLQKAGAENAEVAVDRFIEVDTNGMAEIWVRYGQTNFTAATGIQNRAQISLNHQASRYDRDYHGGINYYRRCSPPQNRVALSSARPPDITREPSYSGTPLYGVLELGANGKVRFPLAMAIETNGQAKLYFDYNQNGDLADDEIRDMSCWSNYYKTTVDFPVQLISPLAERPENVTVMFEIRHADWHSLPGEKSLPFMTLPTLKVEADLNGIRHWILIADTGQPNADYTDDGVELDLDQNGIIDAGENPFPGEPVVVRGDTFFFDVAW